MIIIELTEVANGINLCVKQPVVEDYSGTYDTLHSLPFNQLCYWFTDSEGIRMKAYFQAYMIDSSFRDIRCPSCLDPETWTVEVFDHGRYSSVTKDYLGKEDVTFFDTLFKKVRLTEENAYRIKYSTAYTQH